MNVYVKKKVSKKKSLQGKGLVNSLINSLPVELHLPNYQYCGPGTKLEKRLERGDKGINPLDAACRLHDIAYSSNTDINKRHQADKELANKAWERVKAKDSTLGEKLNAYFVTNAMKSKVKFGLGIKRNLKKSCKQNIFKNAIKTATAVLKKQKPQDIQNAIKTARKVIQHSFRGRKSEITIPRIINVPKIGGFLPLVPIVTALGALGALASGGSSIARAITTTRNGRQQLEESKRHNKALEAIAMGKGLYLKPYKKGYGIFFNKTLKN